MRDYRVGQGFDRHCIGPGHTLTLGGVVIPWEYGLIGHSDADVVLHAITDALLGAAGLGDIGELFPDTDRSYRGADSRDLLRQAWARVAALEWQIENLDVTVFAQQPKISPYKPAIAASIAQTLGMAAERVNVKAKTGENVGTIGRAEAMDAAAIVLLSRPGTPR